MAESREHREVPRVPLPEPPTTQMPGGLEVRVLDLSLKGARIEHPDLLHPGLPCHLELPAALGALRLAAQVVWCTIIGAEPTPGGERRLRAQSGLRFEAITADQRMVLADALQQLAAGTA